MLLIAVGTEEDGSMLPWFKHSRGLRKKRSQLRLTFKPAGSLSVSLMLLLVLCFCRRLCWISRLWITTVTQHLQTRPEDICVWWRQGADDGRSFRKGVYYSSVLSFLLLYIIVDTDKKNSTCGKLKPLNFVITTNKRLYTLQAVNSCVRMNRKYCVVKTSWNQHHG